MRISFLTSKYVSGTGPVTIHGAAAADVSYPGFWDDLARLSA